MLMMLLNHDADEYDGSDCWSVNAPINRIRQPMNLQDWGQMTTGRERIYCSLGLFHHHL